MSPLYPHPFHQVLKVFFLIWPALFGKRAATFAAAAELTFPFTTSNKLCKMKTINQQQQRRVFHVIVTLEGLFSWKAPTKT